MYVPPVDPPKIPPNTSSSSPEDKKNGKWSGYAVSNDLSKGNPEVALTSSKVSRRYSLPSSADEIDESADSDDKKPVRFNLNFSSLDDLEKIDEIYVSKISKNSTEMSESNGQSTAAGEGLKLNQVQSSKEKTKKSNESFEKSVTQEQMTTDFVDEFEDEDELDFTETLKKADVAEEKTEVAEEKTEAGKELVQHEEDEIKIANTQEKFIETNSIIKSEAEVIKANTESEVEITIANTESEAEVTIANTESEVEITIANTESEAEATIANTESEAEVTIANTESEAVLEKTYYESMEIKEINKDFRIVEIENKFRFVIFSKYEQMLFDFLESNKIEIKNRAIISKKLNEKLDPNLSLPSAEEMEKNCKAVLKDIFKKILIENKNDPLLKIHFKNLLKKFESEFEEFHHREIEPLLLQQKLEIKFIEFIIKSEEKQNNQNKTNDNTIIKEKETYVLKERKIDDIKNSVYLGEKEVVIFFLEKIVKNINERNKEEEIFKELARLRDYIIFMEIIFKEIMVSELKLATVKNDNIKCVILIDEIGRQGIHTAVAA